MKILAFTDIHGNEHILQEVAKLAKKKKPDLIICPGDITVFEKKMKEILEKLNKIEIPLFIIPGNHEEAGDMKKLCDKLENVVFLHRGVFEVDDYLFFGYGGDGFSRENLEFEKVAKSVEKRLKGKKVVLITHQPPYGTKLDDLEYFEHVGNKSYRKFILKNKPVLALSGHLHENFGAIDKLGKTVLINPGPLGKIIQI